MKQLVAWGLVAVLAMQTRAEAQPQPQPQQPQQPQPQQPQPQQPPQPQPQQPPPFYRFTLNDGRVLDVQIVGGDAVNYHVQTGGAVYSLPRASVVSSVALAQPIVYAAPPPPQVAEPVDDRDWIHRNRRTAGWAYLAAGYLIVAPIALAKMDNDSDATSGLIPVVGPLIWTMTNDEDDAFEDGWDWLAASDTLIQTFGIYLVLTGGNDKPAAKTVRLMPMTGRSSHGFAVGGSF